MKNNPKSVVALGKFDGIHIGHAKLISTAVEIALSGNMPMIVYTIGTSGAKTITDEREKKDILKLLGVDEIRYRSLEDGLKDMMPKEFIKEILVSELNAACVVVGENFRFGRGRCGDSNLLKKLCLDFGIDVIIKDTVCTEDSNGKLEPVSSTLIRSLIADGKVSKALELLNRPYFVKGEVSEGKHLGRNLGFPTINMYPLKESLVPKNGVYASKVIIDGKEYNAITNVGDNPTVDDGKDIKIETHIFDFKENCYGKCAYVNFIEFIREEVKFEGLKELTKQVKNDVLKAKEILK